MIVLHKLSRQAKCFELISAKSLCEETTTILENFRNNYNHFTEPSRFNIDLHSLIAFV